MRRHRAHRQPVPRSPGGVRAPLRPSRRVLSDAVFALVWRLGHWSYVLLFLGAALESAAFLGFVVPGETIVVSGGVLASFGVLGLPETLVVAVAGALTGDNVGYWLGRRLGRPWLLQYGPRIGVSVDMLRRVDELFERHGGKAVLVGRFIGFLRAMVPFAAGSSRMPYARFFVNNAIGATAWGIGFVLLGYFLGSSWPIVERWVGRVGIVAGLIVIVATVVWLKRRRVTSDRGGSE